MKTETVPLAILGAKPTFETPLHVGRPNIGDRAAFQRRVDGMFERRWLTNNGPLVQEFESRLREQAAVKNAIAFCNATVALEVLGRAAKLTGEVIVPGFTFVASAHAFDWLGLSPVFCDVDADSHTIDVSRIEDLITPATSAIVATHVWGQPCAVEELEKLAVKYRIKLFFDAAHAFGCSLNGRPIGGFGDAEVFSFHATKFVNCFEGGAVVTNDDELARELRLMRNFGFAGIDNVVRRGTNAKMPEVCAAMGLTSLDAMIDIVSCNKRNYDIYQQALAGLPGLSVFQYNPNEQNNYQYIVTRVGPAAPLNRDDVAAVLEAENVLVRKYFFPGVHRMAPYNARPLPTNLPVTERLCSEVMALPNGTAVTEADVLAVARIIRLAFDNAEVVRAQLTNPSPDLNRTKTS
jgi:dTDP-4-amino-4,6-dideoxygalactose transaminase